MISKEEMYEFASQIAGITDSDLEAYRCGGKTKKKKDGGNVTQKRHQVKLTGKEEPYVPKAGPAANSRIHGDKSGEDFYESWDGTKVVKEKSGNWVVKYPNGNTRTYRPQDANYKKADAAFQKAYKASLNNAYINGHTHD